MRNVLALLSATKSLVPGRSHRGERAALHKTTAGPGLAR
ncbi:Hypothetical protein (plasmid) [Pseudomonas putida]|nr:Hypothetical protein [Pseudomonas putida]